MYLQEGFRYLSEGFALLPDLRELYLGGNPMGDAGVCYLMDAICQNEGRISGLTR